jgi:DNA helicase HerA-like ATPase
VGPGPYPWSVSAADIDALIKLEQEATITLDKLEQESKITLGKLEQESKVIREALITLERLEQESKITKEALDKLKQGLERELKVTKKTLDKLKQGVGQGLPADAKRGRKPYDWELFKAKFYLMLDDNDVPAHTDVNVQHYADKLMTWGRNNVGGKETPEQAAMRKKVAEWKPLWKRLKGFNK